LKQKRDHERKTKRRVRGCGVFFCELKHLAEQACARSVYGAGANVEETKMRKPLLASALALALLAPSYALAASWTKSGAMMRSSREAA